MSTIQGFGRAQVVIAWDDLGINEVGRFKINCDLKKVYEFLGY